MTLMEGIDKLCYLGEGSLEYRTWYHAWKRGRARTNQSQLSSGPLMYKYDSSKKIPKNRSKNFIFYGLIDDMLWEIINLVF